MTTFAFTELVTCNEVVSAALGVSTSTKLNDKDIGKPVKLAAANNYVVCSTGDQIEGFVSSISPETVNDGFSFGGVATEGRFTCKLDAAQVGTVAVGALVVAGVSAALGTADAYPLVKTGSPGQFFWRVIRIVSGTGVAGDLVLIENIF
jgi:hypothetical protein